MPDDKNKLQTIVEFLVDKASLQKSKRAYDEIEDKAKHSDKEIQKNARSVRDLGDAFTDFGKRGVRALKDLESEYGGLRKLDDDLAQRLRARNDDFNRLSDQVSLGGDFQSNLGAVQGLLGAAGAGGASQAVSVIGEVGALTEELPRLKQSLQGLPDTIRASINAFGTRNAGLFGAIAAGTAIIIAAQQAEAKRTEQLKASLSVGRNARELAANLSQEELEERKQTAESVLEVTRSELNRAKQAYEDFNRDVVDQFGVLGTGIAKVNSFLGTNNTEFRALEETIADLEKQTTEAENDLSSLNIALEATASAANSAEKARIASDEALFADSQKQAEFRRFERDALQSSFATNRQRLSDLDAENTILLKQIDQLKQFGQGTEDNLAQIDALTQAYQDNEQNIRFLREQAIPYTKELDNQAKAQERAKEAVLADNQANQERENVLKRVTQLSEQANSLIERFAEREAQAERRRNDAIQDFQIKREQDTEDHNRKLLDISRQGQKRIEGLNESLDDLQQDFFQSQISNQRKYANELKSIDERRNLDRIQREREGADELDELANENNVIAFLREKRKQDRERQTTAENQDLEDRQRTRQFNEERRQQEQAFLQRRALLQRQIRQEEEAIRQRIDAERNAFQISQDRNQQAFDLAQQRAQRELDLERLKTQAQLRLIQSKAQAEVNAISGTTSQVRILQNAVNGLAATVAKFSSASRSVSSSSSRSVFGLTEEVLRQREANRSAARQLQVSTNNRAAFSDLNRLGVAFGPGGVARRPTLGLVGERPGFHEAMIPFRPSEGIRPALERAGVTTSPNIYLTINAQVGENASVSQVKQMISRAVDESELKITRGVASGIAKARFNASA